MSFDLLEKVQHKICRQWLGWWETTSNKKEELTQGILTVSLLLASFFWLLWILKKLGKEKAELPPGPQGLPLLGYLPFLGTELHHSFTELAHSYGPIYKLWLGKKLCIVLSSPALAKEVSRDLGLTFANRDPPIAALVGTYGGLDIAWSPYGPYWRNMRKIFVREMLSNKSLDECYALRTSEVRKAIRNVYDKYGTPVEIGELAFDTEINVIINMIWGAILDREKSEGIFAEFRQVVTGFVDLLGKPNVSDFFPALARFDLQGVEREMKQCVASIEQVLNSIIDTYRMTKVAAKSEDTFKNKDSKDFFQLLLELKDEEHGKAQLNMTEIKALLMDIIVGGTDTTVVSAEFVMTEVMKHPRIMAEAQKELTEVVGIDNNVEESHLPKLKYLDAVVRETLRLHPPLPLLVPRAASTTCTVGGYTVPKGSRVIVNVYAMHRDPNYWANPNEFKPERFLDKADDFAYSGNNFQYLPFGSGRRICAGITLAEKMVVFIVASLLHSFDWKLPEGEEIDVSDKFGIIVKKKKPLFAIPTPRLSNLELYRK